MNEPELLDLLSRMNGKDAEIHNLLNDIRRIADISDTDLSERLTCNGDARIGNIKSKKLQLHQHELRQLAKLLQSGLAAHDIAYLTTKYPDLPRARQVEAKDQLDEIFKASFGHWLRPRNINFGEFNRQCARDDRAPARGNFLIMRLDQSGEKSEERLFTGWMQVSAGSRTRGLPQFTTVRSTYSGKLRYVRGAIFDYRSVIYSMGQIGDGSGFRFARLKYHEEGGRTHLRGLRLGNSPSTERPLAYRLFAYHLPWRHEAPYTLERVMPFIGAHHLDNDDALAPIRGAVDDIEHIIDWLRIPELPGNALDSPPFDDDGGG